jgi:hypothetical protein
LLLVGSQLDVQDIACIPNRIIGVESRQMAQVWLLDVLARNRQAE